MDIKFLTDAMFGKLTRFLRIFGYNTVYANDLEEIFQIKPFPDEKIVEFAIQENRTIITKDYPLYRKHKDMIIFIEGEDVYSQLTQLKDILHLSFDFAIQNARCSLCNGTLQLVKDIETIKNEIKNQTLKHYDTFYQCTNPKCKKVFWEGTHIKDIVKKLKENLI